MARNTTKAHHSRATTDCPPVTDELIDYIGEYAERLADFKNTKKIPGDEVILKYHGVIDLVGHLRSKKREQDK